MRPKVLFVLLSLICFALFPALASAQFGSISGRVTDEETGLGIALAEVSAINMDSMNVGETLTDSNGYYLVENLLPGYHIVGAYRDGYEEDIYPGLVMVVVREGQNIPDIDFTLTPAGGFGTISGRVTDEQTGLPIEMAGVALRGKPGLWYTDTTGYYLTDSIPNDTYEVIAFKDGFYPETYPDSVTVVSGENIPDIDFALTPLGEPGSISGTITDAETGEPIFGVYVCADGEFGDGQAWTDSAGEYVIDSLYAGYYFVNAWIWNYWQQDYPETVIVTEGQNTPYIDFALIPHGGPGDGIIAGQVVEENSLSPITYAMVFATSSGDNWGFAFTDSTGTYLIQGLPEDNYYVYTLVFGYISEFYDGVYTWEDATPVTPDAYDIDFYLAPEDSGGGMISGTISSDGSPIEDALVYAEACGEMKGCARSSTEGGYMITGLVPGTYTVSASKVSYRNGEYSEPVEVGIGKVGEIDIELSSIQIGDVNTDGEIDIGDVVYLINYLFKSGPAPRYSTAGDANCDSVVDVGDVVYLINYLFKDGPPPSC